MKVIKSTIMILVCVLTMSSCQQDDMVVNVIEVEEKQESVIKTEIAEKVIEKYLQAKRGQLENIEEIEGYVDRELQGFISLTNNRNQQYVRKTQYYTKEEIHTLYAEGAGEVTDFDYVSLLWRFEAPPENWEELLEEMKQDEGFIESMEEMIAELQNQEVIDVNGVELLQMDNVRQDKYEVYTNEEMQQYIILDDGEEKILDEFEYYTFKNKPETYFSYTYIFEDSLIVSNVLDDQGTTRFIHLRIQDNVIISIEEVLN